MSAVPKCKRNAWAVAKLGRPNLNRWIIVQLFVVLYIIWVTPVRVVRLTGQ